MRFHPPFSRSRGAYAALLLGLLLAPGGARPAAASPVPAAAAAPAVCLNVQPPAPEDAAAVLADLRELGVRCIRSSWWTWSTPRSWSWCHAYREAGIEVLPLVYDADGDYRERFRALDRACGPFRYVQLGNEMDGGLQPGREARATGRRWGARIRAAAPLVRRTGARVVGPGLAWNSPGVRDYLEGMLEGAGDALDVVAIHTYGVAVYGEPVSRWKELRKHGWRGPVWITEVGVGDAEAAYVGRNPDEWQRENLMRILRDPALPGLGRLYWFQYTPAPHGWGLLRPDGTPRPAYEALRRRGGR